MKIAATICQTEQVGMEEFRDHKVTKVFKSSASFDDVMAWAETHKVKTFGAISLSTVDESKGVCPLIGVRCDQHEEQTGDMTCDGCPEDTVESPGRVGSLRLTNGDYCDLKCSYLEAGRFCLNYGKKDLMIEVQPAVPLPTFAAPCRCDECKRDDAVVDTEFDTEYGVEYIRCPVCGYHFNQGTLHECARGKDMGPDVPTPKGPINK